MFLKYYIEEYRIVLPGGEYSKIQEREAEPVAIRYQGYGLQCFVLQYSVARSDCYIKALKQLGESIALIRKNSEQWDIDPERIVLCGFSAGAHLAASLVIGSRYQNGCRRKFILMLYYWVIRL